MTLTRRTWMGMLAAAAVSAQAKDYAVRRPKRVEKIWQSPEGHPNGLEATPDGLWVGEQITDRAHLLDWKTGKPLVSYDTQSSNTSGIAAGGGYLWMAANGAPQLRPRKPTDIEQGGRIEKLDLKTGKHVKNYTTPNGGGLHGLLWAQESLWVTQFGPNKILQADTDLNIHHEFDVPLNRAHGLGWDGQYLWCMFSNDFRVLKFDPKSGAILEAIQIEEGSPDPHGMTWADGGLWYCDAGIAPGHQDNKSGAAGWICRIQV